jgi:hypothetical protein
MGLILNISCKSQPGNQPTTIVKPATQQPKQAISFIAANLPDSLIPKFGKYGCTSSTYKGGFYEYTQRGTFEITKDGHYTYYGLDKPSQGTYTVDEKGNLLFSSGYFDNGKAEKIDRPNKFFLVFPSIPGNRWTCGYIDK